MSKPSIFLRPISTHTQKPKSITIKLPPELSEELEKLRTQAERAGFSFDIDSVCVAALTSASKAVSRDLKKIASEGGHE